VTPTAFHLADNVMSISSLTKVFGLGNLQCGWVLAQPELAKRMRRIIDYTNVEGMTGAFPKCVGVNRLFLDFLFQ